LSQNWIDISIPVRNGMVHWPGDPPCHIERICDQEKGDAATISSMSMCVHTGTHMDAPLHFIPGAPSIDAMPLDATIGPARVIHINDAVSITREELSRHAIQPGERILFRTKNSERVWNSDTFHEQFVYISHDAALYLAECRVRAVGIDYLSVSGYGIDEMETHTALLRAGIWIIEGLNLHNIDPGEYELICLPLKIVGADGSPARAVLRKQRGGAQRL
jgi:arylformamidase